MPISIGIWERRDNGDREAMGNTALELCRIIRRRDGITSARFYWSLSETMVFLIEGEAVALDTPGQAAPAEYSRAGLAFADNARQVLNIRLAEPREALGTYRAAGR